MGVVDRIAQVLDLGQRVLPRTGQDVAGELAPVCRVVQVERGGEDEEMVEKVGCFSVLPKGVLILAEVVERIDLLERYLRVSIMACESCGTCAVVGAEQVQILLAVHVAPQFGNGLWVLNDFHHRLSLFLQTLVPRSCFCPELVKVCVRQLCHRITRSSHLWLL